MNINKFIAWAKLNIGRRTQSGIVNLDLDVIADIDLIFLNQSINKPIMSFSQVYAPQLLEPVFYW